MIYIFNFKQSDECVDFTMMCVLCSFMYTIYYDIHILIFTWRVLFPSKLDLIGTIEK